VKNTTQAGQITGKISAKDPFPNALLRSGGIRGLQSLMETKLRISSGIFSQLGPGDILFIDSSHTVKVGGDVSLLRSLAAS